MGFKDTGVGVGELAWLGDQLNIRARVKNIFQVVFRKRGNVRGTYLSKVNNKHFFIFRD